MKASLESVYSGSVIIYGASSAGEAVFQVLREKGNLEKIFFCDDNINKIGEQVQGTQIFSYRDVLKLNRDMPIIITVIHPETIIKKLKKDGFTNYFLCNTLLDNQHFDQFNYNKGFEAGLNEINACIEYHKNYINKNLYLRSLDVVVTERCSLKCRDCANLMQYYIQPQNCNLEKILLDLRKLLTIVDGIYEIRILGGEPFMNVEFHKLIGEIVQLEKVKKIVVYSNATIIPRKDQLPFFFNEKIIFNFTDYGKLSRNIDKICELFDTYKIRYSRMKVENWTACADLKKHNRNYHEQCYVLENCCAKDIITLLNGRLYRCPFIAHANNLGAIEEIYEDYLSLRVLKNNNEGKFAIRTFLNAKYSASCDYCNGRFLDAQPIEPAVQVVKPLPYIRVDTDNLI